jgi:hypothetical protein
MVRKILKKTSKIILYLILVFAILISGGILAGYIYRDEIKNYIISEINNEIDVKVNLSSAELSVFRKFPYVSVLLNEVVALTGKGFSRYEFSGINADTLFTASRIYLQFNILDILHEDYRLRRVHAVNGTFNILVDKRGRVNYRIFKETAGGFDNSFTFGLDGVKISNFTWKYLNLSKKIHSSGVIRDVTLKGNFSLNNFSLNSLSTVFIDSFNREGIDYAKKLEIVSRLILDVRDSVYTIKRGELSLNNLKFTTGGSLTFGSKNILNLQVTGEKLDIKTLLSILPFDSKEIEKMAPAGKAELLAKFRGEISSTKVPSIHAAYKISNGSVNLEGLNKYLNGISIKGTYSNGSQHDAATSRIVLNEYSVSYGKNLLAGKLTIDNFINPFLSATLSGTILVKELSDFVKIEGLKLEQGTLYPDLSVNIQFDSFKDFSIQSVPSKGLNGKISFTTISGKTPFSAIPLDLLEGSISLEGETWFPEIKLKLGRNKISAKLAVNYFWDYLIGKPVIPELLGEIASEFISIPDLIPESDPQIETDYHLPDSIVMNLHCTSDSFAYGKFLASDLETTFSYKPGILNVTGLKLKTMKGKISVSGIIVSDDKKQMLLRTSGELKNIDIHKLFETFSNFGQSFIISDNLKGLATGKFDFSATLNSKLELLTKNLAAQSDLVIEEGELINFEPITELSSFVELSELKHIKFSTLKNSILIRDEKVFIPQMDINSSAFNLSISGIHGFDNYFEYKLRLNLSEILAGKAKKAKKENEEFGIIEAGEAGNTNLYLSVSGTPDNYKIRYDKKEAIGKIKDDIKQERKLLKNILKEELGLYKKDSGTINHKVSPSDQQKFILDWGDEKKLPPDHPDDIKNKKIKKKDPDINVTWEEEEPSLK